MRSEDHHQYAPKYLKPRAAALIYGVHLDYFRKCVELRRERIEVTKRTHLYPVAALDRHFQQRRVK